MSAAGRQRLSLPFLETLDLASITFGRSTLKKERLRLCLGCRTAFIGQCQHLDYELMLPNVDVQHIAHCHCLSRFDAHLIDIHFTAINSVSCQGTRFEETRSTKPLVDAEFLCIVICTHLEALNANVALM